MKRVLILCTGNSCRSQMAEGLWNTLGQPTWEAVSAGSRPAGYVHPLAVRAMGELGIDISNLVSKSVAPYQNENFDLVVTVCDNAKEACPVFPGAKLTLHWPFADPAHAEGNDEEKMVMFRRVRDEIRDTISGYLKTVS
ncbi:Protein-tyrosine phosphatase, low molecular weight [Planctopirus limnophila DSM 3776]|uniref:Protein-tyrosine phosphatase, low molecular weight n=1 Tax=Planctopirus limnophila (strain ATCC 43296 / DSM 3776 / IFAM 1008 / Mu 290) TaxID=521674 RepID=D5SYJ8_PLAL2|nr:arsenate reductase ArsC [Planctopirus limnophila]ADG67726.1 Protein-tyrosine phosphatase, low molecular weight [Planctopirus limnophila DSM 3776]